MSLMKITSNIRNYVVHFARDAGFFEAFGRMTQRCYAVDHKVWELHRDGCLKRLEGEEVIVLPIDEEEEVSRIRPGTLRPPYRPLGEKEHDSHLHRRRNPAGHYRLCRIDVVPGY